MAAGNVSRVIPDGLVADIDTSTLAVPPLFEYVLERGDIALAEAFRVFNMGIGFVVVVGPDAVGEVAELVPDAVPIGQVTSRESAERVVLTGLTR